MRTGSAITLSVILAEGLGRLTDGNFDNKRHDSPKERRAAATQYVDAYFKNKTNRPVGILPWQTANGNMARVKTLFNELARSEASFVRAKQAMNGGTSPDNPTMIAYFAKMKAELEPLTRSTLTYHQRTRARIAFACTYLNDFDCVRQQYEVFRNKKEAGLQIYVNLGMAYMDGGKTQNASNALTEGIANANKWAPGGWLPPARIAITYALFGDTSHRTAWERRAQETLDKKTYQNSYALMIHRQERWMIVGKTRAEYMFEYQYGSPAVTANQSRFFSDFCIAPL